MKEKVGVRGDKRCNQVDVWVEVELRRILYAKWRDREEGGAATAWTPHRQAFGSEHEWSARGLCPTTAAVQFSPPSDHGLSFQLLSERTQHAERPAFTLLESSCGTTVAFIYLIASVYGTSSN